MRDLLIAVGFGLICLSIVWSKIAEAGPADYVPRTAKVVSLSPDGRARLEDAEHRHLETQLSGYKVGDEVPVWATLTGGDIHGLRDGPMQPNRNWLYLAVSGTLIFLIGLTRPKPKTTSDTP